MSLFNHLSSIRLNACLVRQSQMSQKLNISFRAFYRWKSQSQDIKIQFNNGKEIVVTNKDYGIEYTPLQNGINRISCDFGEIVNINDLESISIGDQIINMK